MDTIYSLDIGCSHISGVVAESTPHGIRVKEHRRVELKAVNRNPLQNRAAILDALENLNKQILRPGLIDEVDTVCSLSGIPISGRITEGLFPIHPSGRSVTRDDVYQVINHCRQILLPEGHDLLQLIPIEFKVNGKRGVKQPIGLSADLLAVSAFAVSAPSQVFGFIQDVFKDAGLATPTLYPGGLGTAIGSLSEDQMELGAAVVDIGLFTTEIATFANGSLVGLTQLAVGGHHISKDLSILLKCEIGEAERLKTRHGSALPDLIPDGDVVEIMQQDQRHPRPLPRKIMAEIIASRLKEIAKLTRSAIKDSGRALPGGIIVTGGTSTLLGASEVFKRELADYNVAVAPETVYGTRVATSEVTAFGLAKFQLESFEELESAVQVGTWQDRVRSFWSLIGGKQ